MAIRTFKIGLLGVCVSSWTMLMSISGSRRTSNRERNAKVVPQDRRDFRSDRYNNNRPRRNFTGHSGSTTTQVVSTMFREPVHRILEKIKNEPFF